MKLLNVFVMFFMLVFIASCGSDPEVDAVVEKMSSEEDWSKSDTKCYVKAIKKGLSDEQWDQFLIMGDFKESETAADDSLENMGAQFAMLPVLMASAVKCGIPLE